MSSYNVWVISEPIDNAEMDKMIGFSPDLRGSRSVFFDLLSKDMKRSDTMIKTLFSPERLHDNNRRGIQAYLDWETACAAKEKLAVAGKTYILALCSITPAPGKLPSRNKSDEQVVLFEKVSQIKVLRHDHPEGNLKINPKRSTRSLYATARTFISRKSDPSEGPKPDSP